MQMCLKTVSGCDYKNRGVAGDVCGCPLLCGDRCSLRKDIGTVTPKTSQGGYGSGAHT